MHVFRLQNVASASQDLSFQAHSLNFCLNNIIIVGFGPLVKLIDVLKDLEVILS
jgi:hypothetical protein